MRNAALSGSLGLGLLLIAAAGCEPVDDGSTSRAKGWDGVLTDNVLPGDREVFTNTDETDTVANGCAKTTDDAHKILQDQCAACHGDPATASGLPPWDFVLDDAKMKTEKWVREGQPSIPFIDVGHPQTSAIFIRAAIARDMPPVQRDPSQAYYERVTLSGASVLQQWITNCM
jgi:hypothetical protein